MRKKTRRSVRRLSRRFTAFLPNLRPGEAAIIGTDFPIPLTIQIREPVTKPLSDGPNYQKHWAT
jgi:DNA helicase HerA-like ATPase